MNIKMNYIHIMHVKNKCIYIYFLNHVKTIKYTFMHVKQCVKQLLNPFNIV